MKLVLINKRLFAIKLIALCAGTVLFVPLAYYRLYVPAYIYGAALLGLHGYFLYLYLVRTPWRQFLRSKKTFTARTAAVIFFIYLLSLIHIGGTPTQVLVKLCAAFTIHVGILAGLMLAPQNYSEYESTPHASAPKHRII